MSRPIRSPSWMNRPNISSLRRIPHLLVVATLVGLLPQTITFSSKNAPPVVVRATGTPASAYGPRVENIPEDRFSWTAELTRGFGTSTSWGCGVVDDNDLTKLYAAKDTGTQIVRFDNEVEAATYGTATAGLSSTEISGPLAVCDRIINNQLYFFQRGMTNTDNFIFRRLNLDDNQFYTVAGSDIARTGNDGTGTAASFGTPHSCTFNHDGTIAWVTDFDYHIIRKIVINPASPFSTDSGVVTTVLGTKGTTGMNIGTYNEGDATPMQNPLNSGLNVKLNQPKGLRYYRNDDGHEFLFIGSDGFCGIERCNVTDGYLCRAWNGKASCSGNQKGPWTAEHEVMSTTTALSMRLYFPRSFLVIDENTVLAAEINALKGYRYVPGDGTYRLGPRLESGGYTLVEDLLGTGSFSMRLGRSGYARVVLPECIVRIGNTNAGYFLPDNHQPHHFTFGQSRTMTETLPAPTPVPPTPVPPTPVPPTPVPPTPVPPTPVPPTPVPPTPAPVTPAPGSPVPPTPAPTTTSGNSATPQPTTSTAAQSPATPVGSTVPNPTTTGSNAPSTTIQTSDTTSPSSTVTATSATTTTTTTTAATTTAAAAAAQRDANSQETSSGMTTAEEAGLGVSLGFLLLIIGVIVGCCVFRNRQRAAEDEEKKKAKQQFTNQQEPYAIPSSTILPSPEGEPETAKEEHSATSVEPNAAVSEKDGPDSMPI